MPAFYKRGRFLSAFILRKSKSPPYYKEPSELLVFFSNLKNKRVLWMTLNLETATFEALVLRSSRGGKFENVDAPLLLAHACTTPFGVELDSQFAPLPIFAGGNDPRKHLTVQLELTEDEAQGLRRLDSACEAASLSTGTWSPLVTLRE